MSKGGGETTILKYFDSGSVGHAPSTPVNTSWVRGVQGVKYVSGDIGEGADVAAAAGLGHETGGFVLCFEAKREQSTTMHGRWRRVLGAVAAINRTQGDWEIPQV